MIPLREYYFLFCSTQQLPRLGPFEGLFELTVRLPRALNLAMCNALASTEKCDNVCCAQLDVEVPGHCKE